MADCLISVPALLAAQVVAAALAVVMQLDEVK
jgi:hypothetical protein